MQPHLDLSTKISSDCLGARTKFRRFFAITSGAMGFLFAVSTVSMAQGAMSPPGRLLASNCAQCHGMTDSAAGFDRLTGKAASKLLRKLHKYQSGAEGDGIMTRHAMGYSDQQLRDLAQWLSQQR
jgi:sulfide dehydrogenase cytochrome subunit